MKSTVESSVISRSQSEANADKGKIQLIHATTTKFDTFFPMFDQLCMKSHLPKILYYISAIYIYYQVFFSSFYPMNKFWLETNTDRTLFSSNTKIITILTTLEKVAWFLHVEEDNLDSNLRKTNGETDLLTPVIIMAAIFLFSLFVILVEIFGSSKLHRIRKISFYVIRFVLDIISPIMIIPTSALFSISIRNLVISNDKLNWIYLFTGVIMYIIFIAYTYISFIIMNQSTCITKTLFSTFNFKVPLFLPLICSFFVIAQFIFSVFQCWAMVIIQLSHLVVSIIVFYPMIYLVFHMKIANIIFIGVTLSTWFNDLVFVVLYFISPPTANNNGSMTNKIYFFYISGLIIPLIFLIISLVLSSLFVNIVLKKILKELNKLSELDNTGNDLQTSTTANISLQDEKILSSSKLFKNEKLTLMSIHISFLNCLPIFYKWRAVSYALLSMPTKNVLLTSAQYMSFFPGASRRLNTLLNMIASNRDLNYHQRFLLYQIFRIKMMRQSSVSPDANRRLSELKASSAQNYEDIYSFFSSKTSSVKYLEMISNENWKIDSKWEEAIRDFPNFQKFSDEYCTYLIECEMDLERALVMKHRSSLIELGRNFTIDMPFISLANNLPIYLKNGVVDPQGSFRQRQRDLGNGSANMQANGTQNSSTSTISKTSSFGNASFGSSGLFSSSSSMLSSNYNLDPEFEEQLGRQLFRQTLLRLELHRGLSHRKSYASLLLLIYAYIILIGGCALLLGIYIYINNYIVQRSDSMYYLNLASKGRFYLDMAILGSTLKFSYYTNRFTTLKMFNDLDLNDNIIEKKEGSVYDKANYNGYDADMFHVNDQISYSMIHRNVLISMDSFNELLVSLGLLSDSGENIYEFAHTMMENIIPFITCFRGVPGNQVNTSLKAMESYVYLNIASIAGKNVEEGNWFNSDDICEILANQPSIEAGTLMLFQTLMDYEVTLCEEEDKFIDIFKFAFPCVPIIVILIPVLIMNKLFMKDTDKLISILLGASSSAKEEAKSPIRKDSNYEISQISEKKPKGKHWVILRIVLIILCILSTLCLYFMLSETKELNLSIQKLGRWNLLGTVRMSNAIETMNYLLLAVILNGTSSLNITSSPNAVATRSYAIKNCKQSIIELENANEAMLKGRGPIPPCTGFDDQLDNINFDVTCDVANDNNTNLHDSYRCSSASQGVTIFIAMIRAVLDEMDQTSGNFDHEMIVHSLHLLNRHLIDRLELAVDRIHEINVIMCQSLESKTLITFCLGLVTTFFIFITVLLFYTKSVNVYNIGLVLAQRFPPTAYLSDKKLLNFILNRKEGKGESAMPTAQSAIYMSLDPIICTNGSGIIEIINPAVTETLGYTPDQLLGQQITSIFSENTDNNNNSTNNDNDNNEPQTQKNTENNNNNDNNNNNKSENNENNKSKNNNDDGEKKDGGGAENDDGLSGDAGRVLSQIELMKNGQSTLVFEDHFLCMTDDAKDMPCGVTILGMTSSGQTGTTENAGKRGLSSVSVESFVFILRDETQLVEQQKAAEAAKAQSENLLFQILPRDIVTRLNSGEKDVSFTVNSASVIFTDIVKFSEYAAGLSPQQIMGSLSTLFSSFDGVAKKYKLITKIKLIGDIYMAAAGLFAADINPKEHAEEILRFGLDCLLELDEVNIKLNANLQLRVGINSGGPLLAGVLGTDKPVFDIIGDTINVAARLQTTDIPGKVQIPKSTYELVSDCDFWIEERGDVFLKGKGKTKAYLVFPYQPSNIVPVTSTSSDNII